MKRDAGSSGLMRRETGAARSVKGPIEHAAAVPGLPVVVPRASWRPILSLIVSTLREWRRRHVGRRELATSGCSATSASIPVSSTTRCASRSGGPFAIGAIDRRASLKWRR